MIKECGLSKIYRPIMMKQEITKDLSIKKKKKIKL